jgi:hypothetical protein
VYRDVADRLTRTAEGSNESLKVTGMSIHVGSSQPARAWRIDVETRLHENQVRALATCSDRRHRGADAELPRFIACGRHDASLAGASDGDRFAAQIWVVALFDGRVKRIHVDMNDLSLPLRGRCAADIVRIIDHSLGS